MPAKKNAFSLSGVLKSSVVGSFARFGVAVQHVAERLRAAPVAEPLGEQRADLVRIEVADDDDLGVRWRRRSPRGSSRSLADRRRR